ncbi:cyanophycinase [Fulvivirga lutea]|uniref:Cyanophycinase n=1 Tax=Fulvivirga lutea TaxID=2810512 RepID=A0A974ZZK3_9BACT|nr:cyanophycinase [Fulvivirga lutea]QSE96324.1 cyanophycinase [Fulvivirga lutea]
MKQLYFLLFSISTLLLACNEQPVEEQSVNEVTNTAQGQLFIIGGGSRPPILVNKIIELANLKSGAYGIILPMSSSEPDSAIYYANLQFLNAGISNVVGMNFEKGDSPTPSQIDSIANASLIYISGGDQNKFMDIIAGTEIKEAIKTAYKKGSVIAGTSAGAAVMSELMITGNERNYPDYDNTLRSIESNNIITAQGLGLLTTAVVDQHFIKRGRYNRLFSVCIENPDLIGLGIDESTALIVSGDSAEVIGLSQVIRVINNDKQLRKNKHLLGAENLEVSVLLPGDKFALVK